MTDQVELFESIEGKCLAFRGTGVPLSVFHEYLFASQVPERFLKDFPHVPRELVDAYLSRIIPAMTSMQEEHERNETLTPDTVLWEHVGIYVYLGLIYEGAPRIVDDESVRLVIGGQFAAYFYVSLNDGPEFVVTKQHMQRWGITVETLVKQTTDDPLTTFDWPRVQDGINLYANNDYEEGWLPHVIDPGCMLSHKEVEGRPIIFIPGPGDCLVTGTGEPEGLRCLLHEAIRRCAGKFPLTRRPLIINDDWTKWETWPDSENPLADEFRRHFD